MKINYPNMAIKLGLNGMIFFFIILGVISSRTENALTTIILFGLALAFAFISDIPNMRDSIKLLKEERE